MKRRWLLLVISVALALGVAFGGVAAVAARGFCWTERTVNVNVLESISVTPEGAIDIDVYTGCCTEAEYTVTNISDHALRVFVKVVDGVPYGLTVTVNGDDCCFAPSECVVAPSCFDEVLCLEPGESQVVTVKVCAACDAQSGTVTLTFAPDCGEQGECPTCPQ